MKKTLFFLILMMLGITLFSQAPVRDLPVVTKSGKSYYQYEVKPKETLYSLCRRFNVTEAELLAQNPSIVEGLKSGQTLFIPVKSAEAKNEVQPPGKEAKFVPANDGNDSSQRIVPGKEQRKRTIYLSSDRPRIALLLPFAATTAPAATERYIEFYEGFLLAVDSLKSLGLSFEVEAIESGFDEESVRNLIQSGRLDQADYCVGGVTSAQISLLSDWAKKNRRNLVLPFSSRIPELDRNPYIFQTNTPHSYLFERLADYAASKARGTHVIILKSPYDTDDSRAPLLDLVRNRFKVYGIPITEIESDENLEGLFKVLSPDRLNQIMPTPLGLQEANNLVTKLAAFKKAHPEYPMSLVGYPDWQAMPKTYQKRLYELNTTIYSTFYADSQKPNVRNFQLLFGKTYGKNLLNTFPKYSMMGYDIASWFIPRMVFEKSEILDEVPTINPLQNHYQFGHDSPLGGACNQSFYLIRYMPDNDVEVSILH